MNQQEADDFARSLVDAWNAGNADDYGRLFAEDADFIHIFGGYAQGRAAIADAHANLFRTIYAGSNLAVSVHRIRDLTPDLAVLFLTQELVLADGHATRQFSARPTWLVRRDRDGWRILVFHNTAINAGHLALQSEHPYAD